MRSVLSWLIWEVAKSNKDPLNLPIDHSHLVAAQHRALDCIYVARPWIQDTFTLVKDEQDGGSYKLTMSKTRLNLSSTFVYRIYK